MAFIGALGALATPLASLAAAAMINTCSPHPVRALALEELRFPPLRKVRLPSYTRHELRNGLVVYLMEDHEVPLIGGTLLLHGGSYLDPGDKIGLSSMTAAVMRAGGSEKLNAKHLEELLASKAAYIGATANGASMRMAFSCLKEDITPVMEAFDDLIRHPLFPDDNVALMKQQGFGSIARRNDDPNDIARQQSFKLVYGDTSPYARNSEYATLSAITADDLREVHRARWSPDNGILAIVGDFSTMDMLRRIDSLLGRWPRADQRLVVSAPPVDEAGALSRRATVFLVNKPELSQSYVQMAMLGGRLDDPDYFALDVFNAILDGLGGRLSNELRSKSGLAYSVFGEWRPAYDHRGLFVAGGETSSNDGAQLVDFLNGLLSTLRQVDQDGVTEEELAYAKESTLNSFVFNFTNADDVLSRVVTYAFYGYPEDFVERYRRGVGAVMVDDVVRTSREHVKEDDLIITIVANARRVEPALKRAGFNVVRRDISIPPPPRPATNTASKAVPTNGNGSAKSQTNDSGNNGGGPNLSQPPSGQPSPPPSLGDAPSLSPPETPLVPYPSIPAPPPDVSKMPVIPPPESSSTMPIIPPPPDTSSMPVIPPPQTADPAPSDNLPTGRPF